MKYIYIIYLTFLANVAFAQGGYKIEFVFFKYLKYEKDTIDTPMLIESDTFNIKDEIFVNLCLGVKLYYISWRGEEPGSIGGIDNIHSLNFCNLTPDNIRFCINDDLIFLDQSFFIKQNRYKNGVIVSTTPIASNISDSWRLKNINDLIKKNNSKNLKCGVTGTIHVLAKIPKKLVKEGVNSFELTILFVKDNAVKRKYKLKYIQEKEFSIFKDKPNIKNSIYSSYRKSLFIVPR